MADSYTLAAYTEKEVSDERLDSLPVLFPPEVNMAKREDAWDRHRSAPATAESDPELVSTSWVAHKQFPYQLSYLMDLNVFGPRRDVLQLWISGRTLRDLVDLLEDEGTSLLGLFEVLCLKIQARRGIWIMDEPDYYDAAKIVRSGVLPREFLPETYAVFGEPAWAQALLARGGRPQWSLNGDWVVTADSFLIR
jgi:hypothetical protein